jgi:hypothetical protein
MIQRLDEHIEFHEAIDSHKSDTAFLRAVKEYVQSLESQLNRFVKQELNSISHICDLNTAFGHDECLICGKQV